MKSIEEMLSIRYALGYGSTAAVGIATIIIGAAGQSKRNNDVWGIYFKC